MMWAIGFDEGLARLNTLRQYLASGDAFAGNPELTVRYDAYAAADFSAGGLENADAIATDRALLREIMEEKYVSTFATLIPFDDFRRLRVTDSDIVLPVPINSGSAYPERFLISQDEIDGNPNVPSPIPDIFQKTPVNQ